MNISKVSKIIISHLLPILLRYIYLILIKEKCKMYEIV